MVDCARALPFDEALAVPQVFLPGVGRPDLVDRHLGIVVECDSFGLHAERTDLARDCRRYHACAVRDLAVVRFTWEDGMSGPDYVVRTLTDLVRVRTGRRAVRRRGDVLPA